jgi:hypothetical protein
MEKYRLVEEHKGEGEDFLEQTSESEVRITQQGKPRNYISYAMNLFVSCVLKLSCCCSVLLCVSSTDSLYPTNPASRLKALTL